MLVERAHQMELLRSAASSTGALVLVVGEAGAGKTSLVKAVTNEAKGRPVLFGRCDSLQTARPFGPLTDWATAADPGLLAELHRGLKRAEVLERAHSLLVRTRPIAVIEDLHWADDATIDMLVHLGRRIAGTGAALAVTYRGDEVQPGSPLALALGDLATAETVRVAVPLLTRDGVAALAADQQVDIDDLYRRTGGNAFFVTECLATPDDVPTTVRDAVLARLHRLPADAVEAAGAISIFAGAAPLAALEHLGIDRIAIDPCLDDGLLVLHDDAIGFRHELARLAVTNALPAGQRRRLHQQVLDHVERQAVPDEALAVHHALEAGDVPAIVRHALPAAAYAEARGSRREAVEHLLLARKVGAATSPEQQADLHRRLAGLYDEMAEFDRSVEAYDVAADLATDPSSRARLQVRSLGPLTMAGRLDEADARLDAAVETLAPLPPGPELASAWAQRCSLLMLSRRLHEAVPWGAKAVALASELGEWETLAYAQIQGGTAQFMAGESAGYATVRAGIELAREHGSARLVAHGLSQIGSGGGEVRDYAIAMEALRECIAYSEANEQYSRGLYSQAWLGRCLVETGDWATATSTLVSVLESPRATGVTRMTALTALGRLRARRGDPDPWSLLDEALTLAQSSGQLQRLWPVAAARAEAAWVAGDLSPEMPLITTVLAQAESLEQRWATGELALWAHRGGRPPTAAPIAEPYALAVAGRAADAAQAWLDLGCAYDAADALAHSPVDADQLQALALWKGLGATASIGRLVEMRRDAGLTVPRGPNAATLGNAAGLTAREIEILHFLIDGLRNPEIATATHLSTKTVSHHVSHILAKLGVSNRTEAVGAAARMGIKR